MTPPRSSGGSGGSGGSSRAYMSDVVKAAAHPTRQAILKALEKAPRTTMELERETGENRYHLYHHLSVLESAGLVLSRVAGKAKEFSLLKPKRPEAVYLELHADDPTEKDKLLQLLKVVGLISDGAIPHLDRVTRARLMLSYPWSPEGEN
jgi:DNA-binding transcriptional ArsR family regulator